jgi:hypothetical protein
MLPFPIATDNAAMDAEPPISIPRKRKCRWYQFSLRTLMIGVTIFCVVAGWFLSQAAIVWKLKAMLDEAPVWSVDDDESAEIPWFRHAIGDRGIGTIVLDKPFTDEQLDRYRTACPDASIYRTDIAKARALSAVSPRRSYYLPPRR